MANGSTLGGGGTYGYVGTGSNTGTGAIVIPYSGVDVNIPSAVSGNAPSGVVFTGVSYCPNFSELYALTSTGLLYIVSNSGFMHVASLGGGPIANTLCCSGSTLLTLLSAAGEIGAFNLSASATATTGIVTPSGISHLTCLNVDPVVGTVAVGGYNFSTLSGAITQIAPNPILENISLMCEPTYDSGSVAILTNNNNVLSVSGVSGLGNPTYCTWLPNGVGSLISDPVAGSVLVGNYSFGALSFSGSVSVTSAGQLAAPGNTAALVCQTNTSQIIPLSLVGNVWSSGAPISLTGNPFSIISNGPSGAIAGFASGIAYLVLGLSGWSVTSSASLGFVPRDVAYDGNYVYAVGTSGASGYLSIVSGTSGVATLSWPGSGGGVMAYRSQVLVADPSDGALLVFAPATGTWALQNTYSGVAGNTLPCMSEGTILSPGTSSVYTGQWTAPYQVSPIRTGCYAMSGSTGWASGVFGVNYWPQALAFDSYGTAWYITLQNYLCPVTSAGVSLGKSLAPIFSGQTSGTPIGFSNLLWLNGELWATSSLAGPLARVR